MKVTLDVRHVGLPGIGRFATELAAALLRRDGDPDVVVIGPVPGRARGWLGPAALTAPAAGAVLRSRPFGLLDGPRLSAAVRGVRADVHHATHLAIPARLRVPVVLTVHDLFPMAHRGHARSAAATAYYRVALPRAVQRAHATVAVSEYTASEMRRLLGVEPTAVIGHGVDHAAWKAEMQGDGWVGWERVPSPGYVLYVGTAKPHKNLVTLIEAHARAPHLPPLVLAGPTARECARLGPRANGRTVALGRVPDAVLPALYRRAGVVAVPSLYEGVGLAALEAMSFGVPVAAADSPGLRDAVGDAAALVPATDPAGWADALGRLAPGSGGLPLRELLVERGLRRAAAHRWDDVAAAYADVYARAAEVAAHR